MASRVILPSFFEEFTSSTRNQKDENRKTTGCKSFYVMVLVVLQFKFHKFIAILNPVVELVESTQLTVFPFMSRRITIVTWIKNRWLAPNILVDSSEIISRWRVYCNNKMFSSTHPHTSAVSPHYLSKMSNLIHQLITPSLGRLNTKILGPVRLFFSVPEKGNKFIFFN